MYIFVSLLVVCVSSTILNRQYLNNVSLNAEESPYYINSDVIIHETMFIAAGVEIIFNYTSTLHIIGSIHACNDNNVDPIKIFSLGFNMNPAINIRVDLGGNAIFCNIQFESMANAMNIGCPSFNQCGNQSGSVQIYNTSFQNIRHAVTFSDDGNTEHPETTTLNIFDSTFNETNVIINSSQHMTNININFKNCLFLNFDTILLHYNARVAITDSNIIGNGMQTCLSGGNGMLTNVTIRNCNIAIEMLSTLTTGFDIFYSNLKDNNIGIISGAYSSIYGTNFLNNKINIQHTSINDRLYDYNFWGTYNENGIVAKIMDVCNDEYNYNSTQRYGLIIWWPFIPAIIEQHNDSFIESAATDITRHSLAYCQRHILPPSVYTSHEYANITLLEENSPFYVVSDTIICDDLYINSGSYLIFTGDYILFIADGIHTCLAAVGTPGVTIFNGQNYGIPNDKTHRGSMMIDAVSGVATNVCYVTFTGMKSALIMAGGGSKISISHCTFNNLQSAISSYSGTTITDTAHAVCWNNVTTTTATPEQTEVSSTFIIDTTQLTNIAVETTFITSEVIIDPTLTSHESHDHDSNEDSDEYCDGVTDDTLDFFTIDGECNACAVPADHAVIMRCLKQSFYDYYSRKYDISWHLDDMLCDELVVVNMDESNIKNVCTDKYAIKFKLDVVFDNDLIAQKQFDKIVTDTQKKNDILSEEIQDDVATFMVFCEPEFEMIDCKITGIVSNAPLNTSSATASLMFAIDMFTSAFFIAFICMSL